MANLITGQVVKNSQSKTIAVKVVTYKNHPLYRKRFIYTKKYLVHDPQNQAQLQDTVLIRQSRPISRRKRWILEKIVHSPLAAAGSTPKKTSTKTAGSKKPPPKGSEKAKLKTSDKPKPTETKS